MMKRSDYIYQTLQQMYPDAHCQLNYGSDFQLAVAVLLSAQTTDVSVNRVTEKLFARFPDALSMAAADISELEECIHELGLFRNKAANIKKMSQQIVKRFDGRLPDNMDDLVSLPGIGVKCANVILAEIYHVPAFPVDTHVNRISRRLAISDAGDSLASTEQKLKDFFPKERWIRMHHLLIFFGRNRCSARNPQCQGCPFIDFCTEKNQQF